MRGDDVSSRTRLAAGERRGQLLRAAEEQLLVQGYLPLPVDQVAKAIGVSKALVYTYYPTQHDLFNASLELRLEELRSSQARTNDLPLAEFALAKAEQYFKQVVEIGPVVQFILRDAFMARNFSAKARRLREGIVRPIVRRLRDELRMSANEAIAAFNLLATIPEEAGSLVRKRETKPDRARELYTELMVAALAGLKKRPRQ
jgi:AcrR family transcriptional regulator